MLTYTISMPAPHTHLYQLTIALDGLVEPQVDMVLPSWTPGSYMIREFARHVQNFTASTADGTPLPWHKSAKDTWCIATGGAAQVTVQYQVYANDLTVRTSHLDGSHGYFNGATVFMYVPGRTNEQLRLLIETPPGWQVSTGLTPHPSAPQTDAHHAFTALDYDELLDCPVECGTQRLLSFTVDAIPHQIALWGQGNADEARLVTDTKHIVETQRTFFGRLPYAHYTFLLHLTDGKDGGLEHRNSVTNQIDRWSFRTERSYERYLALTSHELFHVWNIKRLRPAPLGPFNYRAETYTRLLWLAEGATSYYDELLLVRAGLMRPERYLEHLAERMVALQNQPGRHLQSLEQSSFDAWIKFYRPDEHSTNTSISYYVKGNLVCLLLDMQIRAQTGGTRSLDDVLRLLFARYPANGPGIPEDGGVLAAVEAVAGTGDGQYRAFFARYIAGTEELDYAGALATVGLELRWSRRGPQAWLGLSFKRQGERTFVATVRADGPASPVGVYANDELLALDGWRVNEKRLGARLAEYSPGAVVRLTLFRGDALVEVPVTLAEAPADTLELALMAEPSQAQAQAYRNWLLGA